MRNFRIGTGSCENRAKILCENQFLCEFKTARATGMLAHNLAMLCGLATKLVYSLAPKHAMSSSPVAALEPRATVDMHAKVVGIPVPVLDFGAASEPLGVSPRTCTLHAHLHVGTERLNKGSTILHRFESREQPDST